MFNQIKNNFKFLPTPLAGLALGISSLGALWESLYPAHGMIQTITAIIAAVMLVSLLLRFILHPQSLWADLSHHVVGSVVPTFAMASMVVASACNNNWPQLATAIWLLAIVSHVVFLAIFVYQRLRNMQIEHMVPSWFVPPVGIIVAVFTCPQPVMFSDLCQAILIFGLVSYAILLPIMLNRLIFCEKVPAGARASIGILAAPASLCLTGYLAYTTAPSPLIVAVLLGIALLMTLVIYMALVHLLRMPFNPGFSAFTFPLVISAKALYSTSYWMQSVDIASHYVVQVQLIAQFELWVATAIVVWVSCAYLKCLLTKLTALYATRHQVSMCNC